MQVWQLLVEGGGTLTLTLAVHLAGGDGTRTLWQQAAVQVLSGSGKHTLAAGGGTRTLQQWVAVHVHSGRRWRYTYTLAAVHVQSWQRYT